MGLGKYAVLAISAAALVASGCQRPDPKASAELQPQAKVSPQPPIQISEADAAAIVELGKSLIKADDTRKKEKISTSVVVGGPEVDALRGTSPHVESDGAYFRKGMFCLGKERGFFVPRNPAAFSPPATGGVTYVPVSDGLYRYEKECS